MFVSHVSEIVIQETLNADDRVSGGWRWAPDGVAPPPAPLLNASQLDLRRQRIVGMMSSHVKGSRPSLSAKVTDQVKQAGIGIRVLTGKWMAFERNARQSKKMDEQWAKVKQGVRDNKLGFSAKITDGNPGSRVMCIYTYSFLDEVDVWRVLDQLHAVGVYPSTWKADIMTLLGIYSSKAQDASGRHRPDLYIPGLNMGWFLPAHRPTYML